MNTNKVAIVHEWFDTLGGSESVVEQLLHLYPHADLYSLVDFLPPEQRWIIQNKKVNTSFIQNLPFSRRKFRNYLAFMPLAIEQFDLTGYPLVLSSSHAFAKGFIPTPGQVHISYIHTPIRYAWDLQSVYLKNSNMEKGVKSLIARSILHYIRNWDSRTANGVDVLIANSNFTAQRIWKYYRRESTVIYPPVDVESFQVCETKEDYFLTVSRLVHYKQVDIIIDAFRQLPDQRLVVIGDGPLFDQLNRTKPENVELLGRRDRADVIKAMQKARALVYAAKEDFGIVPVEAQACGTPVIAYGAGGALETVNPVESENPTGIFFTEQTTSAVLEGIKLFLPNRELIKSTNCRKNAERFSIELFRSEMKEIIHQNVVER
jgi:glycosyltransferase involved in cell wall biosynthesis